MQPLNNHYSLVIAWKWELDAAFVSCIESMAAERGLTILQVTTENLDEATRRISEGSVTLDCYYDRASDEDAAFIPLTTAAEHRASMHGSTMRVINPRVYTQRASNKATMHSEFLAHGIRVPASLIIPPYESHPHYQATTEALRTLGSRFVAKPANTTGGGMGVVVGISTSEEIRSARAALPTDAFLLQEIIRPAYAGDFRGWFRVFYAFGESILCWWDDQTHAYEEIAPSDERYFGLTTLRDLIFKIQRICNLDFFSTEFAWATTGEFVAVDYVNEICDMRLQSKFPNGVPDTIVERIGGLLIGTVEKTAGKPRRD